MAKLSARGRTELLRVEKEKHADSDIVSYQRWTIVFTSDGTVLEKYDVRFLPDSYHPKGRFHSYGWKRKGKYTLSIAETKERYEKVGWKAVS